MAGIYTWQTETHPSDPTRTIYTLEWGAHRVHVERMGQRWCSSIFNAHADRTSSASISYRHSLHAAKNNGIATAIQLLGPRPRDGETKPVRDRIVWRHRKAVTSSRKGVETTTSPERWDLRWGRHELSVVPSNDAWWVILKSNEGIITQGGSYGSLGDAQRGAREVARKMWGPRPTDTAVWQNYRHWSLAPDVHGFSVEARSWPGGWRYAVQRNDGKTPLVIVNHGPYATEGLAQQAGVEMAQKLASVGA